jgi:hypothetical protein
MIEPVLFDAGGIDKAVLLRELVNLAWCTQEELRMLPLRDARMEIALRLRDEAGPGGKGPLYFEYMDGIRLGIDLAGDQVDLTRYRNANFPDLGAEELKRRLYDRIAQYALKDAESGLVAREWVRTSARGGRVTETPLEGSLVDAAFQDPKRGHVVRVSGTVVRDDDGQLAVRSWNKRTGRTEIPVPRDASVTVKDGVSR